MKNIYLIKTGLKAAIGQNRSFFKLFSTIKRNTPAIALNCKDFLTDRTIYRAKTPFPLKLVR